MLRRRMICLLPLLLLPSLLSAPARAEKNLARPPGTTRFLPMTERLRALLAYDQSQGAHRMALSSLGRSVQGRTLWMVTLHDVAPPPTDTDALDVPPKRLFFLCRQHGHEPASTEGALEFVTQLVKCAPGSPLAQQLQRVTVYVIPMANPDGAEAFLRHNAHDKDINRDWLRRTQPETQAIYRAIMRLRPTMMADQHELYPDDPRPDFTETAGPGSGASDALVQTCDTAQADVQAAMQAAGCATAAHLVTDHHPARLAHRYGCVVAGVPTLLFETNRLARLHRSVAARAQAHLQFMLALLRDTAGDIPIAVPLAAAPVAVPPAADHPSADSPSPDSAPSSAKDGE